VIREDIRTDPLLMASDREDETVSLPTLPVEVRDMPVWEFLEALELEKARIVSQHAYINGSQIVRIKTRI